MKLSFFNSLPDDIPLVLGQRVQDKPAQAPTMGDQAYSFMAGVAADLKKPVTIAIECVVKKEDIKDEGVNAIASSGGIRSFDDIMRALRGEIKRQDVLDCLREIKEKRGIEVARSVLTIYGNANKFTDVDEDHLRPLMKACINVLYGGETP